jgi:hypothetical protein
MIARSPAFLQPARRIDEVARDVDARESSKDVPLHRR